MKGKPDPRSPGESAIYNACLSGEFEEMGFPDPDWFNAQLFHDRKHIFDIVWLDEMIVMEVQGGKWTGGGHSRKGVDPWKAGYYKLVRAQLEGWFMFLCPNDRVLDVEILVELGKVFCVRDSKRFDIDAHMHWRERNGVLSRPERG